MALLAAQPLDDVVGTVVFAFGAVVFACFIVYQVYKDRVRQRESAARLAAAEAERRKSAGTDSADRRATMSEPDRVMFEQHKRMNDLTIAKLEAEVALLQAQLKTRADDDDRLHAAKEYHELSVEKTKLEIDSLRLHIAEQRKRLDEFGLGGG